MSEPKKFTLMRALVPFESLSGGRIKEGALLRVYEPTPDVWVDEVLKDKTVIKHRISSKSLALNTKADDTDFMTSDIREGKTLFMLTQDLKDVGGCIAPKGATVVVTGHANPSQVNAEVFEPGKRLPYGTAFDAKELLCSVREMVNPTSVEEAVRRGHDKSEVFVLLADLPSQEGIRVPKGAQVTVMGEVSQELTRIKWLSVSGEEVKRLIVNTELFKSSRKGLDPIVPPGPSMVTQKMKFRCLRKTEYEHHYFEIVLVPVHGDTPENSKFWKETPNGEIRIGGVKKAVADFYVVGESYYVSMTPSQFV